MHKNFINAISILSLMSGNSSIFDDIPNLSCSANATGFPISIQSISGVWYEAVRVPNVEVTECLNVTAPAAVSNNNYALNLEYYSTVNGNWQSKHETVNFPWNNKTENGIFELHYDAGQYKVMVIFKLVYTDYKNVAFVCGYSNISPIPLLKIMTRERELLPNVQNMIQEIADKYGIGNEIAWEEQSLDRCNRSSSIVLNLLTLCLVALLVLIKNIFS